MRLTYSSSFSCEQASVSISVTSAKPPNIFSPQYISYLQFNEGFLDGYITILEAEAAQICQAFFLLLKRTIVIMFGLSIQPSTCYQALSTEALGS